MENFLSSPLPSGTFSHTEVIISKFIRFTDTQASPLWQGRSPKGEETIYMKHLPTNLAMKSIM